MKKMVLLGAAVAPALLISGCHKAEKNADQAAAAKPAAMATTSDAMTSAGDDRGNDVNKGNDVDKGNDVNKGNDVDKGNDVNK